LVRGYQSQVKWAGRVPFHAYAWPRALHSRFARRTALRAGELSRGVGLRGFESNQLAFRTNPVAWRESHSPHHFMHPQKCHLPSKHCRSLNPHSYHHCQPTQENCPPTSTTPRNPTQQPETIQINDAESNQRHVQSSTFL